MKLSIIIPVYNVEHYVKKCIDSIYSQDVDMSEFEVVFVDDGSTDGTREVIRENLRPNTKILCQENSKQGAARNLGLSAASGEYVWFVDGDDLICNGAFREIFAIIDRSPFDILFFKYKRIVSYGEETIALQTPAVKSYNGTGYLSMRRLTLGSLYVYRRNFLITNKLLFIRNVVYEDCDFIVKACFCAEKILEADFTPYLALVREDSTTNSSSVFHIDSLKAILSSMIAFAESKRGRDGYSDLCFYCAMVFNTLFYRFRHLDRHLRKSVRLSDKLMSGVISCMLHSRHTKYIFEAVVLLFAFKIIFNEEK